MTMRINFLKEQKKGLSYRKMITLTAVLVGAFLLLISVQYYRAWTAENRLAELEGQIDLIKAAQGIKEGKGGNAQQQLNPIEMVIVSLVNEPPWAEMFDVMSKSVSEGIWLQQVIGDSKDGGLITIEGTAYQARLVPGFLDRLRSYNVFSKVSLMSSEASSKEIDAPLKFKVQAKPKSR